MTEKRKTINGEDIVWAFETLGFDQYAHLMKIYLQRYKDVMKMDKTGGPFDATEAAAAAAAAFGGAEGLPDSTQGFDPATL